MMEDDATSDSNAFDQNMPLASRQETLSVGDEKENKVGRFPR